MSTAGTISISLQVRTFMASRRVPYALQQRVRRQLDVEFAYRQAQVTWPLEKRGIGNGQTLQDPLETLPRILSSILYISNGGHKRS